MSSFADKTKSGTQKSQSSSKFVSAHNRVTTRLVPTSALETFVDALHKIELNRTTVTRISCERCCVVSHLAFLQRSKRCGFFPPDLSRFDELLEDADSTLFHKVAVDSRHVLHLLLPPLSSALQNYSLRHRTHQFSLPDHTGHLMDCNFLIRSLFKDVY